MWKILRATYGHAALRRRIQFFAVLTLMFAGTFAEMFTLGAIVPFLGLLVNPTLADHQPFIVASLDFVAPWVGGTRLAAASLWFAAFTTIAAALRVILSWASLRFIFALGADLGETVYSRILQQPYSYHLQRNSSEALAAIDKVGILVMGLLVHLMQSFIASVMVIAIFLGMLWVNVEVALGAGVVFGCLYLSISLWARSQLLSNGRIIANNGTLRIKAMQEGLGAIRDVILDGNYAVYTRNFAQADRAQRLAQAQNLVWAGAPKYVVESIGLLMFVILALWLSSGAGGVTGAVPTLGALALGAQRLLPYLQNIYNGLANARGNMQSALEAVALLDLPLPLHHAQPLPNNTFHIENNSLPVLELRSVTFSYAPDVPPVLSEISLVVEKGARVGFVGATGSGKSTLIDLIMGLLTPDSGDILVDGKQLTPENLSLWQRRIAHVPQSIFLTDSSIAENIALGCAMHEIDMVRLQLAIQHAQLADVIARMPNNINSRVGERGIQLSGGQRQRIGIARALYKQADILVLDEATSALDTDTESALMDAIYMLNPDIVILVIAHRVSTLDRCKTIVKLT